MTPINEASRAHPLRRGLAHDTALPSASLRNRINANLAALSRLLGARSLRTRSLRARSLGVLPLRIRSLRALPLVALLLGALPLAASAANCTYRDDVLGQTRYRCDDGKQGTLRKDVLGNIKDSGTGTRWRQDNLGNLKGCDGTTYRQDVLGNMRGKNAKTGAQVTWRKDVLGNTRASDGTVCRTDVLGQLKCRGKSVPPAVLKGQ
ncbi:MAG: hypothetical protein ACRC6P_15855 [Shewanella oncorhynchi]